MSLHLAPTFAAQLAAADRPLVGMWVCSGSPVMAEIAAGSGLDWVMIDAEHSPQSLMDIQLQLQAIAPYEVTAVVRAPSADPVQLKQLLDLGSQNLVVPMISTAEQARTAVAAVRYPPAGVRGVGSALARSARWGRIADYLPAADKYVSLFLQIETAEGVRNASEIAAVDGVDGIFVGPSDLAASLGVIGEQSSQSVVSAVQAVFDAVQGAGKPVGVNAFDPAVATTYLKAGASFILVSADVTLVARGSERLAAEFEKITRSLT